LSLTLTNLTIGSLTLGLPVPAAPPSITSSNDAPASMAAAAFSGQGYSLHGLLVTASPSHSVPPF